jgi:hypothetical protein
VAEGNGVAADAGLPDVPAPSPGTGRAIFTRSIAPCCARA